MSEIVERLGKEFSVDEEGHLLNFEDWDLIWVSYCLKINRTLSGSEKLAARLGPGGSLTDDHRKVIDAARDYYRRNGIMPLPSTLAKSCMIPLSKIHELFPLGVNKGVCKIAGLPSRRAENKKYYGGK